MGTMTGTQFQDELVLALDQRTDEGVNSTRLLRWINHAYLHMTYPSVHGFENLRTTEDITLVQDDFDYALDQSVYGYRVLTIRDAYHLTSTTPTFSTPRARLKPRNVRWFDQSTHANGPPRFFVAGEGEQILMSPVPGANEVGQIVRLRLTREADPILDTTTTVVPSYFDEVLVLGAQAVAEYRLGYRDRARETLEHYVALLNDPTQKDDLDAENWGHQSQLIQQPHMGVST